MADLMAKLRRAHRMSVSEQRRETLYGAAADEISRLRLVIRRAYKAGESGNELGVAMILGAEARLDKETKDG